MATHLSQSESQLFSSVLRLVLPALTSACFPSTHLRLYTSAAPKMSLLSSLPGKFLLILSGQALVSTSPLTSFLLEGFWNFAN